MIERTRHIREEDHPATDLGRRGKLGETAGMHESVHPEGETPGGMKLPHPRRDIASPNHGVDARQERQRRRRTESRLAVPLAGKREAQRGGHYERRGERGLKSRRQHIAEQERVADDGETERQRRERFYRLTKRPQREQADSLHLQEKTEDDQRRTPAEVRRGRRQGRGADQRQDDRDHGRAGLKVAPPPGFRAAAISRADQAP